MFISLAFAIRIVEAMGNAAFLTASFTIIATEFPQSVGTSFATLETFFGLGLIVGPMVSHDHVIALVLTVKKYLNLGHRQRMHFCVQCRLFLILSEMSLREFFNYFFHSFPCAPIHFFNSSYQLIDTFSLFIFIFT